jgi:WD40 repeat protein
MSAAFSPDGTRIVTGSNDGTARIWDAATAKSKKGVNGVRQVTARALAAVSDWCRRDRHRSLRQISVARHEGGVTSAAFSPDGARIVTTVSSLGMAGLWDAATGQKIATLRSHEEWVKSAAFSPDGARIITGSNDGTARIWDAVTGQKIAALRGHEGWVSSAAFSPSGNRIVTVGSFKARIWDASTGREIAALGGLEDRVECACFSPAGDSIVTIGRDNTARLRDASTGWEIASIVLDASVRALAVADGLFALGDGFGRIHVFEAKEFLRPKGSVP